MGRHSFLKVAFIFIAGCLTALVLLAPVGAHVTEEFDHLFTQHVKPALGYKKVKKTASVPANDTKFLRVQCPRGKRVVGGGVDATSGNPGDPHYIDHRVIGTFPDEGNDGWGAFIANEGTFTSDATVYAICARM